MNFDSNYVYCAKRYLTEDIQAKLRRIERLIDSDKRKHKVPKEKLV